MDEWLIDRFASKAPVAVMFRSLFARIFSDAALDQVFAGHCERQIESPLLFSYLVNLLVPVISGASKSVCASHQSSDSLYSRQAVYDKLKGVEAPVAQGLLRHCVAEISAIRKLTGVKADPVRGYHTFVIDGKTYNATEHRLKESRLDARAPLPGRAVAIFDTRYEMFVDIQCDPNAHRCERKILEPLLDRLLPGALYLADRNFSDGIVLQKFFDAGAFFIVRQHGACPAWREIAGQPSKARGVCSQGGKVSQQNIEVQLSDGTWQKVRRVSVKLAKPTRDGDVEIHLLTNLPSTVAARKVADAYRERWTIETCLGHLSRALNAEIRSLCYPGAAGLCFVLALVLFNLMSTIKSTLLKYGQRDRRYEVTDLSYYYLADEILRMQGGLEIATDSEQWS